MVYILVLFLVAFTFVGYLKERNIYNPLFLMNIMWLLFTTLSFFAFYGVDRPSNKTYSMILLGLLAFNIGILLMNNRYFVFKKKMHPNNISKSRSKGNNFNYKLLYILYTMVIIFLASQSLNVVQLLLNGYSMDTIRHLYVDNLNTSSVVVNFRGYISTPIVYLSLPILAIDYFNGKRDKVLIFMTFGMVALWVLSSGGGRSILIWLILYFFFAKLIFGEKISLKLNYKTKVAITIGISLIIFYMIFMSIERKVDFNLFKEFFIYFGVPIIHMEYRINVIDTHFPNYYSFGLSSLNGLTQTFFLTLRVFKVIGSYPDPFLRANELSFEVLETGINVGGEITNMNAFATIFYQFYIDGRIFGVVLGMFFFGIFVGHFYSRMMLTFSNKYVLIYLLLAQKLVFSMVRFYFNQVNQTISFILAFFVFTYVYDRYKSVKVIK
ncbi:O-antigen polymerase [Bacillus massilinigeriensis]|uniref:O-antigen polymerase n=1 Tax=Bacillus mediterraneensis TaxID=1805474 RepID=UPI0008F94EA0|nr:O-antigen polymerase [Bacillus mediterraneensis]